MNSSFLALLLLLLTIGGGISLISLGENNSAQAQEETLPEKN